MNQWKDNMERLSTQELIHSRSKSVNIMKHTKSPTAKENMEYEISVLDAMINARQQLIMNFEETLENNQE